MAAFDGKDVIIKLKTGASLTRVCAKTKTFTVNGEAIDITQDCDGGFAKTLATAGTRSITLAVEGIMEDGTLLGKMTDPASASAEFDGEITFPSLFTFAGKFFVSGFSAGAEIGSAVTVSFTMTSSGAWTRTVPAP